MEITFLGTSAGSPTAERSLTAIVLNMMKKRRSLWLFDCGEATQMQMKKANFSLSKLEVIFITHLHGDHLFGLPGVLTSRSLMQNQSAITLVGPKGIKKFVETVLECSASWLSYPLNIIEIDQDCTVFDDNTFYVEAKALTHRVPCFGYRIVEKDPLIPPHKVKQKKEERQVNEETNSLASFKKGKKIAILGDTIPCSASIALAKDVDILIHEATQEAALAQKARDRGHSTTVEAATIAKQANAKRLIITHISPRYQLKDTERLVGECQTIFTHTEMATDFATFTISR